MMRKGARSKKGAAVAWQQPLLSAVQQGLSAVARHSDGSSPLQALLLCHQTQGPPRLEGPADIDASLSQTGPNGSPQLNVRVVDALDREDFSGKPYVAFILRCRFGDREWVLEKRFSKFHALHEQLVTLLGRDLAARLPALPPRLPSLLLGQHPGCNSREVQDRRQKLDVYMQGLVKLAAAPCGPLEGRDFSAGDDDTQKNMLHVLHELYKYVQFVGHVVPGKGDRALDDGEDNSDEERENESSFRSPALVYAITQVKRLREQLVDKQLAIDSARELKQHLGLQLVQTKEEVAQLEKTLADTADEIEAVLRAQHQQRQEQLLAAAKAKSSGLLACVYVHRCICAPVCAFVVLCLSVPPTSLSLSHSEKAVMAGDGSSPSSRRPHTSLSPQGYMPLTSSPFASAAAAVSSRFWQHRSGASAAKAPSLPPSLPPSPPAPASETTSSQQQPDRGSLPLQEDSHGAPGSAAPSEEQGGVVGAGAGGGAGRQGVDEFAVALFGIRGKLQLLKEQHFYQQRSWVSMWRGPSKDESRWREVESEVQKLSLAFEGGAHEAGQGASAAAARSRLESSFRGKEGEAKVEWCLKVTALSLLRDNIALWKSLGALAAAKRRAVDKMALMSIEGAWVGRAPQEPRTLLASIRSLKLPSKRISPPAQACCSPPAASRGSVWSPEAPCVHANVTAKAPEHTPSPPAASSRCESSSGGRGVGGEEPGSSEDSGCCVEGEDIAGEECGASEYFKMSRKIQLERAHASPSIRDRVSSFMMRARTSLGGQRGTGAEDCVVGGKAGAGDGASKGVGGGISGPKGDEDVSGPQDVATAVGNLSRTIEEGIYLMTSELEDIAQTRSGLRVDIGAATRQLAQLQAELKKVQAERDDAIARAHAYTAVTQSMAEHERYLILERDGLLLDEAS